MNGITTITQRGQVVIPQSIRQLFGLQPADKLFFEIKEDKIIATPILSIDDALGIIKTKIKVSKKQYKKVIAEKVIKKFKKR